MEALREFLIDALETHHTRRGKIIGHFIVFSIIVSILVFMLETTELAPFWERFLRSIEIVIFAIFSLEYLLRLMIARHKGAFMISILSVVDLLVLISFYGHFWNLAALRGLRIFRVFQLLKITRQSRIMISFVRAFRYYRDEMNIFSLTLFLVLFLSSTGFYHLEKATNPSINNIFDSFWWSIVTIFTVGYGDTVPITMGGKLLAAVIMFMGLATIAIMTALITKVFLDHFFGKRVHHCDQCHFSYHDNDAHYCKNCGATLNLIKLRSSRLAHPHRSIHKAPEADKSSSKTKSTVKKKAVLKTPRKKNKK